MAFLFIGGEDTDFLPYGQTWAFSTGETRAFRSAFSRGAMYDGPNGQGYADMIRPLAATFQAASTSFWFSARFFFDNVRGSCGNTLLAFYDAGKIRVSFKINTDQTVTAFTWDDTGTATAVATSTGSIQLSVQQRYDFQIDLSGRLNLYVDNQQILTFTGALGIGASTSVNRFALFNPKIAYSYACEIIVAQTDTRTLNLKTHVPNGSGSVNEWTGSYADIDEVPANGSDVIYATAAEKNASFAVSGLPSGTYAVRAVKVTGSGAHGETGPANVALGLKPGTGAVFYGPTQPLDTTWSPVGTIFEQNPNTGLAFTTTDLINFEVAVRSKS